MDVARALAGGLAANRMLFGATYLSRPERAGPGWIGTAARLPGTQVIVRSQGARDVVLGAGALAALARGRDHEARGWAAAHALADGADLVATWLARDGLPRRGRWMGLVLAGASTAAATVAVARLGK